MKIHVTVSYGFVLEHNADKQTRLYACDLRHAGYPCCSAVCVITE